MPVDVRRQSRGWRVSGGSACSTSSGRRGGRSTALHVSELLEATACLRQLHTLNVRCTGNFRAPSSPRDCRLYYDADTRSLSRFCKASPSLRSLKITGTIGLPFNQVLVLSKHPVLQHLTVSCFESDMYEVEPLPAKVQERRGGTLKQLDLKVGLVGPLGWATPDVWTGS